eukprot:jgi/Orpsp1_1/1183819/evm.model.c7180000086830.1
MEQNDISITNILVDNNSLNENDFKPNPFQRDILKRSKSKTKKDFNKFLFNTAQQKINKKLTLNNSQSKINKTNNKNNLKINENDISNSPNMNIDDSMTEYKDAKEHYSIIIDDDSVVMENKNTKNSEAITEENILDKSLYINNSNKKITSENILNRNEINSRRLETLVNSLGSMNENVKKRIISHISRNPNLMNTSTTINSASSTATYGNKYNDNNKGINSLKSKKSISLFQNNLKNNDETEIIEINDEQSFTSNTQLNKEQNNNDNSESIKSNINKSAFKPYLPLNRLNHKTENIHKKQSFSGSLISRTANENNKYIIDLDNSINDNLTLTIDSEKNNFNNNNNNNNNNLFSTPSNNLINKNKNVENKFKRFSTQSLDRGKSSYIQYLNEESNMNKKDYDTLSVKSSKSLKYEDFLNSPINTPSKISEMLINNQKSSSFFSNYNKSPTTSYSADSFFEKSKYLLSTNTNDRKKPISSPLFLKSINDNKEIFKINDIENINDINDEFNNNNNNNNNMIKPIDSIEYKINKKEDEKEKEDNENYEHSVITDDNNNISMKLGFYSPILIKNNLNNDYKNNHQENKSESNQPINNNLSVLSPTPSLDEINKSNSNSFDNNSRKRPANNIIQAIDSEIINNEENLSLIVLSDSSSQRKSETKHLNPDNNIEVSNKKSKIRSPRNINSTLELNMQPSSSNSNTIVYTESQIEDIKKKLIEKYEKQLENVRKDCMEWEQRCIESNNKHKEIENVLDEYEITITRMIKDSQKEKERQELRINELLEERNYLQESSEIMETSFKELRLKFEEFKTQNEIFSKNEELMKQTITSLQNDVLCASQRYEQIKSHAEEKLEMANIEIAKVRNNFDKELSAMKAKLLRKELDSQSLNQKIKALQEQINIKTKENEELATICDALVSKLEN